MTIAAIAATTVVAAAGVAAYSHHAFLGEVINHEKTVRIATMADLKNQNENDDFVSISPHPWMAPDAKDITVTFITTEEPGWNVKYTSQTGLTPELLKAGQCEAASHPPQPALAVDWLPSTVADGDVYECDKIFVTQQGDTVYGWEAD
ncbi:hypothetical protein [Agreia bicolorata]|uniref:hypothetical protein n=1 Tax=Agreia bicolorata TaxID=110935 RepID=UPI0011177B2A|nr:hypothetical protein [Agreia bicolorata]